MKIRNTSYLQGCALLSLRKKNGFLVKEYIFSVANRIYDKNYNSRPFTSFLIESKLPSRLVCEPFPFDCFTHGFQHLCAAEIIIINLKGEIRAASFRTA